MRSGMKSKKELSYSELLKDSRWQEKRLRVFERDNWCCCECHRPARAGGISLNAHHRFYNKRRWENPWEYPIEWLETLCGACHEEREKAIALLKTALLYASTGELIGWSKRIAKEQKQPAAKLARQTKVNKLTAPPVAIILPGTGKTVWDQMRAAANGLVALQELRK